MWHHTHHQGAAEQRRAGGARFGRGAAEQCLLNRAACGPLPQAFREGSRPPLTEWWWAGGGGTSPEGQGDNWAKQCLSKP